MAYLNSQQRDELLDELVKMKFNRAKGKLRRMGGKLDVFRNVQNPGEWMTRYELPDRGTIVTLIEDRDGPEGGPSVRDKVKYNLVRVIVEPTPDNRT